MKNSDKPTCGDLGYSNKQGEPCGNVQGWGTDFEDGACKHHRGTSPDGESHKNNGHAMKHGLNADDDKLYARLSGERKAIVDSIVDSLIERYREYHGREPDRDETEDFFEIGMQAIHRRFVRDYMAEQWDESGNPMLEHVEMEKNGEKKEFNRPIELLDEITDSMRETRLMKKHTGLFKDPDTQQAEAMEKTLAEVLRES